MPDLKLTRVLLGIGATMIIATVLFILLKTAISEAFAGTIALGAGVGIGVAIDRRVYEPQRHAFRDALLLGISTAAGWAGAQVILHYFR